MGLQREDVDARRCKSMKDGRLRALADAAADHTQRRKIGQSN
jgi:hypothetical protein